MKARGKKDFGEKRRTQKKIYQGSMPFDGNGELWSVPNGRWESRAGLHSEMYQKKGEEPVGNLLRWEIWGNAGSI